MKNRLKPGDPVTIYRLRFECLPLIEGEATIVAAHQREPNLYRVQFTNERQPRTRLVHGGAWQIAPDKMLRALVDHWRASVAPETYGDFSPHPNANQTQRRGR